LFLNDVTLQTGAFRGRLPTWLALDTAQSRCTSLQNLALREIAKYLTGPATGLSAALIYTTTRFAHKRDGKPVGGRGISAFSANFSWLQDIPSAVQL